MKGKYQDLQLVSPMKSGFHVNFIKQVHQYVNHNTLIKLIN